YGADRLHASPHGRPAYRRDRRCAERAVQLGQAGGLPCGRQAATLSRPPRRRSVMTHFPPHFSEEDLIAYQLHESSEEAAIQRHIEQCAECAALSDSIAETLRVFSSDPVPQPDLERNWQRLRGNLSVLTPEPRRSLFPRFALWSGAGLAAVAILLVVFVSIHITRDRDHIAALLPALDRVTHPNTAINGHGPLTTEPTDPSVANHLDAAERLLTEVNHTSGSLDPATRAQAHDLLLSNAVYVRTA